MNKRRYAEKFDFCDLRLDPERRLCPKFDAYSMALFPLAPPDEMGLRVVDDCAQEHIQ